MEKKPIKRNPNIVKLSKDHHASLLFCWKLRQGVKLHVDIERMDKYVDYFWSQHFAQHFKEEEEILFAPVQDDKVLKAIEDHKKIKSLVDEIISRKKEDAKRLSTLADMVDDHVRYEERILFPHLETVLSGEQLEAIGSRLSDEPLLDTYQDNFWVKVSSL